jgi:hypothetical protein
MGFKVTFGPKGAITSRVVGNDVVQFDVPQRRAVTVVSESGNATISANTTLMRPMNTAGVTASLPGISDAIVGNEFVVLKNSGSNPLLLSGTNPIVGQPGTAVGLWACSVSASAGRYNCLAISGSTGFQWFVHGSAS